MSQNTMVLGVSLPFVFIISTIQSSCFNISVLPTLLIDSRRYFASVWADKHLDRILHGKLFDNCLLSFPICSPSESQ